MCNPIAIYGNYITHDMFICITIEVLIYAMLLLYTVKQRIFVKTKQKNTK